MVDSPKALAREADILITMLPSSPHVQKVYLDEKEGFLSGLLERNAHAPTPILIDSSTIEPRVSQQVRHAITHAIPKAIAVDAPVSGGILGAEAATLTFMVGASQEEFTRVKPILSWMGKDIVHCGPPGMGQVAKICNNMLLGELKHFSIVKRLSLCFCVFEGISMVAVAETLNLGKRFVVNFEKKINVILNCLRLGMDPKILSGIINKSSGRCWSSEVYNPVPGVLPNVPSSRNYAGGFGVHLMAKDMGLAVQAALHSKSSVFLGSLTQQVYDTVHHSVVKEEKETEPEYLYGKDFSVVYKWLSSNDSRNEAPPPPKYLK